MAQPHKRRSSEERRWRLWKERMGRTLAGRTPLLLGKRRVDKGVGGWFLQFDRGARGV